MRLFYDQSSTLLRAEAALLAADAALLAACAFFVTGAIDGGTRGDLGLLLVWAIFPRAAARLVAQAGKPSRGLPAFGGAVGLAALVAFLVAVGWDLVSSVAPHGRPAALETTCVLFAAWGSAFLLTIPRAYRLFDFLAWSAVLLALKDARPHALLWVPACFVASYASSATRHLLHDVLEGGRRMPINLQNARAVAVLAAGCATATFLGAYGALRPVLGDGDRAAEPVERGRLHADLVDGDEGSRRGARASPVSVALPAEPAAAKAARRIGFSYRIGLRDLAFARVDGREVLRVSAEPGTSAAASWRPGPFTLWKGVSFSSFDPDTDGWIEESEYDHEPWPANHVLPLKPPRIEIGTVEVVLRHEVVTPVVRNLVLPYFPRDVRSGRFIKVRRNSLGDLFPGPPVAAGTVYVAGVYPAEPGALPPGNAAGVHEDRRLLEVPSPSDLGIDLRALARSVWSGSERDVRAKVAALREHYRRSYRYSMNALWRAGKSPLSRFTEERVGDCTYFATLTTLLLRAGGVSTRLSAGFLGGGWDEEKRVAIVKNSTAHTWTEVFVPGAGWYPVDATSWVPLDPGYQPPREALEDLERMSRALASNARSPAGPADGAPVTPASSQGSGLTRSGSDGSSEEIEARAREDESPNAKPAQPREEDSMDGASWIQYVGTFQSKGAEDPAAPSPEGPESGIGLPQLGSIASGGATRESPGAARLAEAARDEAQETRERVRALSRAALAVAGAAVLALLAWSYLRPKPAREKKDPAATGEEEPGSQSARAFETFESSDARDRLLLEYLRLQEALARTRAHRRPHQTPLEHARAVTRGRTEVEQAFLDLHRVLYRTVYGGEAADDRATETAARSCKLLRRWLG